MQIIREAGNFQPASGGRIYLALGNFDGIHIGHQRLIKEMVSRARRDGAQTAAFIFEPHPARVLAPENAPRLLVSADRKAELLAELGLDVLIYHSFTPTIARCSPREFVKQILLDCLGVSAAFVGFNYSFGHKGVGTPDRLKELGTEYGFSVYVQSAVTIADRVVSSSQIREYLEEGRVKEAAAMLGYPPMLEGLVAEGEKRGRTIGFPTANLEINPELVLPATGVYAAWAALGDSIHPAVINIGQKPTFHQEYPLSVEAHLIDFDQEIYSQHLRILLYQRLRGEKRFNSVEALVAQITSDRETARQLLGKAGEE